MRPKYPKIRLLQRFPSAPMAVWLIFFFLSNAVAAEAPWLTGEPLRQALQSNVAVTWSNAPTHDALERFAQSQRVAVLLDRRIDPDRRVELEIQDVPLEIAFKQIASRLHCSVSMVGPVAYFAPAPAANRVRTILALRKRELAKLPQKLQIDWQSLRPSNWEDLAEPRELLTALADEVGVTIEGLERIPHDLWAGSRLPPMSMPERLTLILNQFDLTYELADGGKIIRLVPAEDRPRIDESYPAGENSKALTEQLSKIKALESAEIRAADGKILVSGTAENHDIVRQLLAGGTAKKITVQEGDKRYTLRVELPVGKALQQLGKQMGIEIQIDRAAIENAGISLDHKVKIDVKEATFDELFRAVLEPAGLTFDYNGSVLTVKPAK